TKSASKSRPFFSRFPFVGSGSGLNDVELWLSPRPISRQRGPRSLSPASANDRAPSHRSAEDARHRCLCLLERSDVARTNRLSPLIFEIRGATQQFHDCFRRYPLPARSFAFAANRFLHSSRRRAGFFAAPVIFRRLLRRPSNRQTACPDYEPSPRTSRSVYRRRCFVFSWRGCAGRSLTHSRRGCSLSWRLSGGSRPALVARSGRGGRSRKRRRSFLFPEA